MVCWQRLTISRVNLKARTCRVWCPFSVRELLFGVQSLPRFSQLQEPTLNQYQTIMSILDMQDMELSKEALVTRRKKICISIMLKISKKPTVSQSCSDLNSTSPPPQFCSSLRRILRSVPTCLCQPFRYLSDQSFCSAFRSSPVFHHVTQITSHWQWKLESSIFNSLV